ncbi:MAG: hypothetical protein AAF849_12350 [Bacteroidota bacterium]
MSYIKDLIKKLNSEPTQEEYIGNIWGWKFSIFGLVIILLFCGLLAYRYLVMGIPINEREASPFYQDTLPRMEQSVD